MKYKKRDRYRCITSGADGGMIIEVTSSDNKNLIGKVVKSVGSSIKGVGYHSSCWSTGAFEKMKKKKWYRIW